MKTILTILVSQAAIFCLSVFADSTGGGVNSEISQEVKTYDTWNEHKILEAEQQQQDIFLSKQFELQKLIDATQSEIVAKESEAQSAHVAINRLRSMFVEEKKIIPRDPWRLIYGEKRYVNSSGSNFVKFSGQIQEVAPNGIRVLGQYGVSKNLEYFVVNFPYDFKAGESVDPEKIYVAIEDGNYTYVSEDGYAKSLPKLNYGSPCVAPPKGKEIELAAQQLSPQQENQIKEAEQIAKIKDDLVIEAKQRLKIGLYQIAAVQKQAADEMSQAKMQALNYDLDFANKGDMFALKRMGERYRNGDGVEKDLKKADEYRRKSDAAIQAEANRIAEENRLAEQAALKEKFLKNLHLADDLNNVQSTLYVEKCYRYGLGTEIDLSMADKYHAKAVSLGIPQPPNTGWSK